jgi:hypothetical protein
MTIRECEYKIVLMERRLAMNQTLGDFLKITSADDYYIVNIRKGREQIYFGYENEVPEDIKSLKVTEIYIDWASEALGIHVSDEE